MVTMASRAPLGAIFVALLCAGSFYAPRSSASSLISQTCRRTAHESLCVSVLRSTNGTSTAATVQDLAVAALRGARRATLRAKLRSLDLGYEARDAAKKKMKQEKKPAAADADLLAGCDALYSDCLRAASKVAGSVSTGWFDGTADAAGALLQFPERCEGLFAARRVPSPLRRENAEAEVKLGVAYEIIRLLH